MSRSDHFARWYASVNDDVRHRLVEEGWYGEQTTGDAMRADVDRTIAGADTAPPQQFAEVYGRDPQVPEALEGIGARGVENPNGEAVRDAVQDFYGTGQDDDTRLIEAEAEALYGHGPSADQPEAADLYGRQSNEIEQDY